MKNQCLQDDGVDCSSGSIRAFVWDFESSHRVLKVPNGVPLSEGGGRGSIPSISIIPPLSPFNEGLGLKILILDS